ncbi:MAG: transposase [Candidatus Synoicihabitans palmerolidicus]|nr:transposase [Candidatus Synoicihabitans palmerolidicus]
MVRAGKVENCQVGVYACLGRDTRVCLTDFRLYLPEAWTQDLARLDKAKVPEQCRVHKTITRAGLGDDRARAQAGPEVWLGRLRLPVWQHARVAQRGRRPGGALCGRCGQDDQKVWTQQLQLEKPRAGRGRPAKN